MGEFRIVIIEDDHDLRQQMVEYLQLSGFSVVGVGTAAELYRRMAVETFDALVIDIRLPGEDGLSIAAHVRAHADTAIIMVTARSSIEARLQAQDAGADFFMTKPVPLPDLVEALGGLLRRKRGQPQAAPAPASPHPASPHPASPPPAAAALSRKWSLNRLAFSLHAPDGTRIPLTATEVSLLNRLCAPCHAVASRGDLLAAMGYDPTDPSNRNLDAALRRLRVKTKQLSGRPLPLRTVHSVGYALTEDIATADPPSPANPSGTDRVNTAPPPARGA